MGGDVETPGPAPFRRAAPRLPPRCLHEFLRSGKITRGRLPRRSHSRRRLRSRHYRRLKRHMQLSVSGRGHPRARLPARSRETMSLYREIQAAAGRLSREARKAARTWGACAFRSEAGPSRREAHHRQVVLVTRRRGCVAGGGAREGRLIGDAEMSVETRGDSLCMGQGALPRSLGASWRPDSPRPCRISQSAAGSLQLDKAPGVISARFLHWQTRA